MKLNQEFQNAMQWYEWREMEINMRISDIVLGPFSDLNLYPNGVNAAPLVLVL